MNVDAKVLAKVQSCTVTVEERVSLKGKTYRVICAVVNGKTVHLGFCGDREELLLLKAGVKFID